MLSVRASIGLPIFRRQRQDREAAAARHDVSAAVSTRANRLREFQAEAALVHHDSTVFSERLRALRADALPTAHARVDAADAAYRTGQGPLAEVLTARRSRLDVQLRQLELEVSALRNGIELQYFINPGAQP
jgi:outer membrane protein TolC